MAILNIGILAHVDAGKTTLTERILYETGVIDAFGSVDDGTTQTDTMDLERARGITIKSAVASFQFGELTVNLLDTPGHGDFIAEVERSLHVLDGVVLVVSAVEGVQAQTRRLARAVRAANLPLLIFVNKIDRVGARGDRLVDDIGRKPKLRALPMNNPESLGDRDAHVRTQDRDEPAWRDRVIDLLAETNERVIEEIDRTGGDLGRQFLEAELRWGVAAGDVVPVYFGAALTGVGVRELLEGIEEWLPPAEDRSNAPAVGTVFKITRRPGGQKLVYVRLFAESLVVRQQVTIQRRDARGELDLVEERIAGIARFAGGTVIRADAVHAGDIAVLRGLQAARIGDLIGDGATAIGEIAPAFPLPALESVVHPVDPDRITHLRTVLEDLAEQDPLIGLRQRNDEGQISVRLYGEVQKEVMAETLANEYGIEATFEPSRVIYVERPVGAGEHVEFMDDDANPFLVTVGFRVELAESGSGVRVAVLERGEAPPAYHRAIDESVHETLTQGLYGWEVTDCIVSVTHARSILYSSPFSTAGDFRKLSPVALMQALANAGAEVCEPVELLELDVPADTIGAVCGALARARGTVRDTFPDGEFHRIMCEIPTAELALVEQQTCILPLRTCTEAK